MGKDPKKPAMPDKIAFRFERDELYRIVPVNGIWGGPTVRGEVCVEFFYESSALPESVVHQVTPAGALGEELERHPPMLDSLKRHVHIGMVMTAEQAESIGQWLKDKAVELRALKEHKETTDAAGPARH